GELSPCGYWFQNFAGPTPTYSQLLIRSWMIATAFLCAFEIQDEVLLRYLGVLDKRYKHAVNNIKNPFIWLREGVQFFVQLPISVLYWSGLIRYATYNFLTRNFLVKLLNLLIIIIGLVSSVVTIVTGYNPFMDIFIKWLKE
ncbi:hypothetical protein DLM86_31460, partial [Paenibacillus flagellatus]